MIGIDLFTVSFFLLQEDQQIEGLDAGALILLRCFCLCDSFRSLRPSRETQSHPILLTMKELDDSFSEIINCSEPKINELMKLERILLFDTYIVA